MKFKNALKPALHLHFVIARFLCLLGHHKVENKICVKCGKTGFGMPVYQNPPPCPTRKKN